MSADFTTALARVQAALDDYARTRSLREWLVYEAEVERLKAEHMPVSERAAERRERVRR